MISKILLVFTTIVSGVSIASTSTPMQTKDVLIQTVDDLNSISIENYDDAYLGTIFYKPIDESKIKNVNSTLPRLDYMR